MNSATAAAAFSSPAPPASQPSSLRNRIADLQKTVSASRLGLWQKCRLQFYFRYVLQLQRSPTAALHTGSVIHLVLQAWNKARWRNEDCPADHLKALFDQKWIVEQDDRAIIWKDPEEREKSHAWHMLETYFERTPIEPGEKPEAVEVSL